MKGRFMGLAPLVAVSLTLAMALPVSSTSVSTASFQAFSGRAAVLQSAVIGHSVNGRPLRAWRVGDPEARTKAVVMATMHGNEAAPREILRTIRDGRLVHGIDLWLVPVANPDGLARRTRANAHGVDLNRNFPRMWTPQGGQTSSGPRPASEPETKALMRFFAEVNPRFVVSFHQPLAGVDVYGPKKRWFARRLAEHLRLPRKTFACGSGCHGTFTQWFNRRFQGVAVTVELGRHPSRQRLTGSAPRQLVAALGGSHR